MLATRHQTHQRFFFFLPLLERENGVFPKGESRRRRRTVGEEPAESCAGRGFAAAFVVAVAAGDPAAAVAAPVAAPTALAAARRRRPPAAVSLAGTGARGDRLAAESRAAARPERASPSN